ARLHPPADREDLAGRCDQLDRGDPGPAGPDPGARPDARRGRRLRRRPRPRRGAAGRGRTDAAMSAARTEGVARLGKRTKDLTKRLRPGEIAIIDHEDIDRVAAEALVEREPAAVLNVAASTSGRYPNAGPRILVDAGIVVVDSLGDEVFEGVRDGERMTVEDGRVLAEGEPIG